LLLEEKITLIKCVCSGGKCVSFTFSSRFSIAKNPLSSKSDEIIAAIIIDVVAIKSIDTRRTIRKAFFCAWKSDAGSDYYLSLEENLFYDGNNQTEIYRVDAIIIILFAWNNLFDCSEKFAIIWVTLCVFLVKKSFIGISVLIFYCLIYFYLN